MNPFIPEEDTDKPTKVSLSKYQNETEEAEREHKSANFGSKSI